MEESGPKRGGIRIPEENMVNVLYRVVTILIIRSGGYT